MGDGKSALLQNKHWIKRWHFANVLICVGKKAAGKRINFGLGKEVYAVVFLFYFDEFDFCNCACSIAYNSQICEI